MKNLIEKVAMKLNIQNIEIFNDTQFKIEGGFKTTIWPGISEERLTDIMTNDIKVK